MRHRTVGQTGHRKLLQWAAGAACGGLAVGYQIGVIAGALLFIRHDFRLSGLEQGALVAVLPLGAMVGGLLAGRLADALGRRCTLIVDAVVFLVGTGLAVVAPSYGVLLVARALAGLAVGAASSTAPLYLSEIAPPEMRGRLVTGNQVMLTGGILAAFCVDLVFASSGSWRAMFAVGLVPAALLLVGMLRAPETPVWLETHGQPDTATAVVRQIGVRELPKSAARPALILGATLGAIQQFSGINAVIYYTPSIMEKTGLSASNSILYSVIIGVVNVAATVASVRFVDRTGRRPLLLASLAAMSVGLVLLGVTLVAPLGAAESWLSLICIVGYVAAFAFGLGPIFWLLIAEIFPPAARATGASVATAANWFWNFVVGLSFLPVAAAIGQAEVFWLFATVCALGVVFVARYLPETKGRTFTEIDADVHARWNRRRAAAPA